ncbi:MAG: hypothetical protein HYZ28_14105 [Myxococcales bacterium]|nr:hypothetical protein [Myxococcales bacterium]
MRNAFGRNVFAAHRLPLVREAEVARPLPSFDGEVAAGLSLGLDARVAHIEARSSNQAVPEELKPPPMSSLMLMQADGYAAAETEHLLFYLDLGALGSFEAMGLVRLPFARSYVKAGKFLPAVGLKLDSHTALTREPLGLGPRAKDTGLEVGFEPWGFAVQLGLYNGADERALLDTDAGKALTARVEHYSSLGPVKLLGGASALYNAKRRPSGAAPADVREWRLGAHGGLSLGRFTLLGELAYHLEDDRTARVQLPRYAAYTELSALATRGVEAVLTYEFLDPELRLRRNGLHRVGASVELYPFRASELRLLYRYSFGEPDRNALAFQHELITMLHLFF